MYIPSIVFIGPVPLEAVLLLAALGLVTWLLPRLGAAPRTVDLIWAVAAGAMIGDKLSYVALDPGFYLKHPANLIFTPISTVGQAGMAAGAVIGGGWAGLRARLAWTWQDAGPLAVAAAAILAISAFGLDLLGVKSHLPVVAVTVRHLDRWPSYAVWGGLMALLTALLIRQLRRGWSGPALTGLFLSGAGTAWLLTGLTMPDRGQPFTPLQWVALVALALGFRLLSPSPPSRRNLL